MNSPKKKQEEQIVTMSNTQVIELSLPAQHKFLNVVGGCIRALLANEDQLPDRDALVYNIELAVHEACANIVEHAYAGLSGRIDVVFTLASEPRHFIVELKDNGRSFDIAKVTQPDLSKPQTSGYGLFLVHQLMDEVHYTKQAEANIWRLLKYY